MPRAGAAPVLVAPLDEANTYAKNTEVFAPALSVKELPGTDPEAFLKAAIAFANSQLYGTLGANIVIHPATIAQIGRARLEEMLVELRYGTIAINTWTGLGFLSPAGDLGCISRPHAGRRAKRHWRGAQHLLFDKPERTVVEAPFRPFPRNLLSFSFTLLPRPPWFITNRKGAILGRLLVAFQYRPSFLKIPRIFLNALLADRPTTITQASDRRSEVSG